MSIVAVGSVAFDGISSPSGKVDRCLGGSATYFSLAASYFTQVRVVAVVGEDFSAADEDVLKRRGVDTTGIARAKGKTFFWKGDYSDNLNEAKTLATELNVFERFDPQIPANFQNSEFLFLGNIHPTLQRSVRKQMPDAKLVGVDTINFWINGTRKDLEETLKEIDVLLINDTEARMLGGIKNLPLAAQAILRKGPSVLVINQADYGATAFFGEPGKHPFRAPAMPIEEVVDPTGAGDSFAGGFMG